MWKLWDSLMEKAHSDDHPLRFQRAGLSALDTVFRRPDHVTARGPHFRDAVDLKRFMFTVVVALLPALLFGIWNTGNNAYLSIGIKDAGFMAAMIEGAVHILPLLILSYAVGGFWEMIFAQLRGHEIQEGFLVTGMLYVLIVPATVPWWIYILGISFGVVIGKEVFGGVGMNILNVALTARAFLFFAYPAQMSGNVWVATPYHSTDSGLVANAMTSIPAEKIQAFIDGSAKAVDGFSGATALAVVAENKAGSLAAMTKLYSASDMFFGFIPGSIGETSTLALLLGAVILVLTGVGSWRTIVATFAGGYATAFLFQAVSGASNPEMFTMPAHLHLIMGGFALGAIFMATDPVTAPVANLSKLIYGFLIGMLAVLIRNINPAYPEGMMLAILLMNVFAPLIDHYVIGARMKRRVPHAAR